MKIFARASWFRNIKSDEQVALAGVVDHALWSKNDSDRLTKHEKVLARLVLRAVEKGMFDAADIQGILPEHMYRVEP